MKKIRIAQIGTSHDHAAVIFSALRRMTDIFEVVGYAEVPEDDSPYISTKSQMQANLACFEGAKRYTVDELFAMPDLDAVAIETFDLCLVKYAQMAADRGLHIQMDKAAGENAEDFERLLSTVKAKGLTFNMGYMYRFNPCIIDAFKRVKNGEIGKVYSIEAEMSCYYDKDKREWLEQFQGGMMQYLGCHLIDLIVRMQGVPDEIIPYNCASGANDVQAKDMAFAVLKYPNGVSTVKSCMLDAGGFVRRHFSIYGEKGAIEIRPLEHYEGNATKMSSKSTTYLPDEGWHSLGHMKDSGVFDRYEAMLSAFASAVRGNKEAVMDLETEARIQRCLLVADGIACDYKADIKL